MQLANIVIKNAADTNTTFVPTVKDGLLVTFKNRSGSRPSLNPGLSIGMRPMKGVVPRRVTLKVELPYDVTEGDIVKTETVTGFVDIVIPQSASEATIKDALSFVAGLTLDALVEDTSVNGAFPY